MKQLPFIYTMECHVAIERRKFYLLGQHNWRERQEKDKRKTSTVWTGKQNGDRLLDRGQADNCHGSVGPQCGKLQCDGWGGGGTAGYRGINDDGQRLGLGLWTPITVYRWYVVELCTWNLYNFVHQYHPNKINKKEKKDSCTISINPSTSLLLISY